MHNPLPDDGDKSFAFPFQCMMLKINGAWPLANSNPPNVKGYIYYIWSHTIIILIALTCWAQSSFVFHAWGDILTVTECGCTVLMGIHNLLRLIHLSIRRETLKELITEFVKNIWISRYVCTNEHVNVQLDENYLDMVRVERLRIFLLP